MQFPAFRHVVMRKLYVQDNVDDAVVNDDTEDSAFEWIIIYDAVDADDDS